MNQSIYGEISNVVGIIGVIFILAAFFFSQLKHVSVDSVPYLLSNLIGSILITYSLYFHWNLASFLIELAWCSISIMGLVRIYRRIKNSTQKKTGPV
ncbi:MAG: hypothetical protein H0T84_02675 [Tatlockia sp.]|nr:hypothetical protein [Tatlockia sp.]